jgi:hypothetical protein
MNKNSNSKNYDKYILKDLFSSVNGLFAFTFYLRYDISPKEMFGFIKRYRNKGYIIYEDGKMSLTHVGRENIFREIFYNKMGNGLKSNLPEGYESSKIDKNAPYIPIINYLSDDLK